ncbi:protein Bouncer [Boleophthalmus pectinirostris]|uniref:protein Bouncer n=1 Tax=Boleophthalmus pectinirostris TaxID=150288 RepID=UPI000A1C2D26|nr:protein Bouncer [Boleophthalmus pectinirostris]
MSRQRAVHISLLWLYLMLPALLCKNLHCYFSPYLTAEEQGTFKLVVTECPPKEVCYKAQGRYGTHNGLVHRGCMLLEKCGQVKKISLRGAIYNTSYSCCDWSHCNSGTGITTNFVTLFIIIGGRSLTLIGL